MLRNIIVLSVLSLTPAPLLAQSPQGVWQTEPSDGVSLQVRIGPCSHDTGKFCGQISRVVNADYPELIGRTMLLDMAPEGEGAWGGGTIWAPDQNRTYRSKMSLVPAGLRVQGCVAVICRGQTWTRVQ